MGFDHAALGQMVQAKRVREGLSQRAVAALTGVSGSTISRAECGLGRLDADNLVRLASWVGLAPDLFAQDGCETLRKIVDTLDEDETLTSASRSRLSELMRSAYATLAGP